MKRISLVLLTIMSLALLSCDKAKNFKYQSFDPAPDITDDFRVDDSKDPAPSKDREPELPQPPSAPQPPGAPSPKEPVVGDPQVELPPEKSLDERNLDTMLDILFNYALGVPSKKLEDLVMHLENTGLSPIVSLDTNSYTGGITVIRNFKNLVGTRYFIAQYMELEDGSYRLQHISFEYRPGPESFNLVRKAAEARNPLNGTPSIDEEGVVVWPLMFGYQLFVRKLTEGDIYDSPMNVYFPSDIGTIKVGVEIDPHGGGDSFGWDEDDEDEDDGDEYTEYFLEGLI